MFFCWSAQAYTSIPSTSLLLLYADALDDKCSLEILKATADSLNELDKASISAFLSTFQKGCDKNVEYSEWSNELLFQVVEQYPKLFLKVLHENNSIDQKIILQELKTPVNDEIDLEQLIKSVEKASSNNETNKRVLEALFMGYMNK